MFAYFNDSRRGYTEAFSNVDWSFVPCITIFNFIKIHIAQLSCMPKVQAANFIKIQWVIFIIATAYYVVSSTRHYFVFFSNLLHCLSRTECSADFSNLRFSESLFPAMPIFSHSV